MPRLTITLITVVESPAQYGVYYIDASTVASGSIYSFLLGPWDRLKLQGLSLLLVSDGLGLLGCGEVIMSCYVVDTEGREILDWMMDGRSVTPVCERRSRCITCFIKGLLSVS